MIKLKRGAIMDTVTIKFMGGQEDSINFMCKGVFKPNVQKGDLISNVPRETYEKELKDNSKFMLIEEKQPKRVLNKIEKESEAE
jgi:hypothetical protein